MARYYDIDKLKEMIEAKADTLIEGKEAFLCVARWLGLLPPADVVPRAEVDRVYYNLQAVLEERAETRAEVAMEIFEEIEAALAVHTLSDKSEDYADGAYDTLEWVDAKLAEIKKKYTEGGAKNEES